MIKQDNLIKGFENRTDYNCYGADCKKPTMFYSNVELKLLKKCPMVSKSVTPRHSKIPKELLTDIIKQLTKELKNG